MAKDRIEIEVIAKGLEKVEQDIKDLTKATKGMKQQSDDAFAFLKSGWFKMAAVVTTAMVGIKKAMDLSNEFLKFEQGVQAMEKQFGVSASKILKKLKEVSDGTISNADIIASANRAMALNVTKDVDKMAKLLEVARVRGQAMGVDTTQAFNDIVTGIGRASPLILDNLGIITKGWNEEAKAAGQAFDQQFILNKVLEDGAKILERTGGVTLTNAERLQKMNAEFKDIRLVVGKLVSTEFLKLSESLDDIGGGADKVKIVVKTFKTLAFVVSAALVPLRLVAAFFLTTLAPFTAFFEAFNKELLKLGDSFIKFSKGDIKGGLAAIRSAGASAFKDLGDKIETFKKSFGKSFSNAKDVAISSIFDMNKALVDIFKKGEALIDDSTSKNSATLGDALKNDVAAVEEAESKKLEIMRASFDAARQMASDFFAFGQELRQRELDETLASLEAERDMAISGGAAAELKAINQADHQRRIDNLKEEAKAAEEIGDEQLQKEKERELERIKIEDEAKAEELKINEEFNKKIAEAKTEAAKKEKKANIIQSIMNTALSVTKALSSMPPPVSFVMAGLAATLGATQTALIAAQPIPQFRQGTSYSPGGLAQINEDGPELVNLPQGSQVIPNSEINNISTDNSNININVQTNDPIEFVNTLSREYGLDVFGATQ
jgi:hypothetical protein